MIINIQPAKKFKVYALTKEEIKKVPNQRIVAARFGKRIATDNNVWSKSIY